VQCDIGLIQSQSRASHKLSRQGVLGTEYALWNLSTIIDFFKETHSLG